jgi:hypothetical protein
MVPRMWRGTQVISPVSVIMVNIPLIPSEATRMASEGLRHPFNGKVLQEPHRGLSCLVFDLLPEPSIDHLVAVILKYPPREESGRRKGLNPGPIGQHYTGSWI